MPNKLEDAINNGEVKTPTYSPPLRGYLIKDDHDKIWVQDRQGTWIINKSDLVTSGAWDGVDPRFSGKPVCVFTVIARDA